MELAPVNVPLPLPPVDVLIGVLDCVTGAVTGPAAPPCSVKPREGASMNGEVTVGADAGIAEKLAWLELLLPLAM